MDEDRKISILGCTGSIGQNTISVIKSETFEDKVSFSALTANDNLDQLVKNALELKPKFVAIANEKKYKDLKNNLFGTGIEVAAGDLGVAEAASKNSDWVMNAIVGAAGVLPSFEAIRNSKVLALANKESLVCAGKLMQEELALSNCTILPVDSEHCAIFQCLKGSNVNEVEKVLLTASGGPFYSWSLKRMKNVTVAEASNHPRWKMGIKISIDSATMFNKALEVIEAKHLFNLHPSQIEVIIHRESIIHSMVEYVDGSVVAQLGEPDMRGAIGYALNYPLRKPNNSKKLNLTVTRDLTFREPNINKFPALGMAKEVMKRGGLFGTVLNAAKEVALDRFIRGNIKFLQIANLVRKVLDHPDIGFASDKTDYSIDDVIFVDQKTRELTQVL